MATDVQPGQPAPDQVAQLIRSITMWMAPEEVELFDIEGRTLLNEALKGSQPNRTLTDREEFRFGLSDLAEPIRLISLIVGTAKTINELVSLLKSRHKTSPEELQKKWQEQLCDAGLESALAEKLAARFRDDLSELLNKK